MKIQMLRSIVDRHHRLFVIIALAILVAAGTISAKLVSTLLLEPRSQLDRAMLAIEIPQSEAEMAELVPRITVSAWRSAVRWDFLFIAGYLLLFVSLWLPECPATDETSRGRGSVWQNVVYCAIATGIVDCCENASILLCLGNIERGAKLGGSRAFTVLPIFGTLKWLFCFLACRALALQYRDRSSRWHWIGVALRSLTTAGAWAALLAFAGLPGRPVIELTALLSGILLLIASVTRLFPETLAKEVTTLAPA